MSRGLEQLKSNKHRIDLFLLFDALVSLLLELTQTLDLDLLMPLLLELLRLLLHVALLL